MVWPGRFWQWGIRIGRIRRKRTWTKKVQPNHQQIFTQKVYCILCPRFARNATAIWKYLTIKGLGGSWKIFCINDDLTAHQKAQRSHFQRVLTTVYPLAEFRDSYICKSFVAVLLTKRFIKTALNLYCLTCGFVSARTSIIVFPALFDRIC